MVRITNITPDEVNRAQKIEVWRKLAMIDLYASGIYREADNIAVPPVIPLPATSAVQGVETPEMAAKDKVK